MTRRHQLEATLRTLKLSGMLDTLEARLSQARGHDPDAPRHLRKVTQTR